MFYANGLGGIGSLQPPEDAQRTKDVYRNCGLAGLFLLVVSPTLMTVLFAIANHRNELLTVDSREAGTSRVLDFACDYGHIRGIDWGSPDGMLAGLWFFWLLELAISPPYGYQTMQYL